MSVDPLSGNETASQSINRYTYVTNGPTALTDRTGLAVDLIKGQAAICGLEGLDLPCGNVLPSIQGRFATLNETFNLGQWVPPAAVLSRVFFAGQEIGGNSSYLPGYWSGLGTAAEFFVTGTGDSTVIKYSDPKIWEIKISGGETRCDGRTTNRFRVLVQPNPVTFVQ
jgi:hypothetical protein